VHDKISNPESVDVDNGPGEDPDGVDVRYYKKDFWSTENPKYREPHYRLKKSARAVNKIARGRECSLLDVGCGPAALRQLLTPNIRYHGIDISIPDPAPYLEESDILQSPIAVGDQRFDIVVAQGLFEYLGDFQDEKLAEISRLLNEGGTFLVSYVNFGHRDREVYWPYNNVQSFDQFRQSLLRHFSIGNIFPTSHNWHHSEPNKKWLAAANMRFNINIPYVTPILAVEYFFICSQLDPKIAHIRG